MWIAFVILLLFFAAQLVAALMLELYGNFEAISTEGSFSFIPLDQFTPAAIGTATLVAEVLLMVVLWVFRFTSYHPLSVYRRGMPRQWYVGIGGFVLLAFGLSFLLLPFDLNDFGMMAQFEGMKSNVFCLLLLCLVGPMTEEFVFRDGIQRVLAEKGLKPSIAILTSAMAFAVVHGNPMQMVPAFFMGLALGVLYHKTNDLRLCLLAHVLNNSLAVLEMEIPRLDECLETLPMAFVLTLAVMFVSYGTWCIYYFVKK